MEQQYTESELADMDEDTRPSEEDADVCEAIGASFDEPEHEDEGEGHGE